MEVEGCQIKIKLQKYTTSNIKLIYKWVSSISLSNPLEKLFCKDAAFYSN